jgi:hypothetical protein
VAKACDRNNGNNRVDRLRTPFVDRLSIDKDAGADQRRHLFLEMAPAGMPHDYLPGGGGWPGRRSFDLRLGNRMY